MNICLPCLALEKVPEWRCPAAHMSAEEGKAKKVGTRWEALRSVVFKWRWKHDQYAERQRKLCFSKLHVTLRTYYKVRMLHSEVPQVNFIHIPICHILAQLFFHVLSRFLSAKCKHSEKAPSVSSLFARVCPCTCLLSTGCCSPSKRRRTPSYLASSPIHFPRKSEDKSRTSPQAAI